MDMKNKLTAAAMLVTAVVVHEFLMELAIEVLNR